VSSEKIKLKQASKQKAPKSSIAETSAIAKQLETADEHIQLAVDLIYLLESNEMQPDTVLKALDIVQADFQSKLSK
jgi:hypothetical protein